MHVETEVDDGIKWIKMVFVRSLEKPYILASGAMHLSQSHSLNGLHQLVVVVLQGGSLRAAGWCIPSHPHFEASRAQSHRSRRFNIFQHHSTKVSEVEVICHILISTWGFFGIQHILNPLPSGKRLHSELENHHAINGKTHCFYGHVQ